MQRLKIDDGCYEIRGHVADGRGFKARLDPETPRVLQMKWRAPGRERQRQRERTRAGAQRERTP